MSTHLLMTKIFAAFERPWYLASTGIKTGTKVFTHRSVCGHSIFQSMLSPLMLMTNDMPPPMAILVLSCD